MNDTASGLSIQKDGKLKINESNESLSGAIEFTASLKLPAVLDLLKPTALRSNFEALCSWYGIFRQTAHI